MNLTYAAKIIILTGTIFIGIGLLLLFGDKVGFLGKMPGDIRIERDNFSFYFPVATCLLLSAAVTVIMWIIKALK